MEKRFVVSVGMTGHFILNGLSFFLLIIDFLKKGKVNNWLEFNIIVLQTYDIIN